LHKVKIGVIGVGHLGRFHSLNYLQIPEVELIGVTDTDKEKANTVAEETGCKPFDTVDSLLQNVDAVSIAVPTDYHFQVGLKALEQGIHCLMEKPISLSLEEAENLINIGQNKGAILQVGHVERFNPALRALGGFEINPKFIEAHRLAPFNPRGTEVAVVLDLMIHDIEIILNLVNSPVDRVDASGVAVVSDTIDIANVRLHFQNNCVANLTASRISQKKMRKMRMFQKDSYVAVDFLERYSEVYSLEKQSSESGIVVGEIGVGDRKRNVVYYRPEVPEGGGLLKELEAFISTVQGKPVPAVTGEEGKEALAVALQVLQRMED